MAIAVHALSLLHPGYVFTPTNYLNHKGVQMMVDGKLEEAY